MAHPIEPTDPRLDRLLTFLQRDPDNRALLADAAAAAFDVRNFTLARTLIDRAAGGGDLAPAALNLRALIALAEDRHEDAIKDLTALLDAGATAPALRFNLAWAWSCLGNFEEAERFLDDEAIAASNRAPALKVQVLHHLERYDDALATGAQLAEQYPDNELLMGALATLAMDAEQEDLARAYAMRAGDSAEGLAARGMFALETEDFSDAAAMFESAIARQPNNPRAWVGKGLALLSSADAGGAAEAIDKGAEIFGDHLGSWVAAGWAHFIAGNTAQARDRFERVAALDPTFSEGHGGLAVMNILQGDLAEAQRNCEIAMRLDRASMSGALASSLLADAGGNPAAAERIRNMAMNTPIGPGGKTLAQMLASSASGFVRH